MKSNPYTLHDTLIALLCVLFVFGTTHAIGQARREWACRMMCEKNLSQIGKAMLFYANDFKNNLPKAGGRSNDWVRSIPRWSATTPSEAYGLSPGSPSLQGKATVTSSLYLLIKYVEMTPAEFVCKGDPDTREFRLTDVPETLPKGFTLKQAWDFGGWYDPNHNPSRHCSYSYHMPFGSYALRYYDSPALAVIADRNPWMDVRRVDDPNQGWASFMPDLTGTGDPDADRLGNSDVHQQDGQNVFHLDGHVRFYTSSVNKETDDNLYTLAADPSPLGKAKGVVPRVYGYNENDPNTHPYNRQDSVLVQESL